MSLSGGCTRVAAHIALGITLVATSVSPAHTEGPLRHCGNEYERSCKENQRDEWNQRCDTGLKLAGGVPCGGEGEQCGTCVNHKRMRISLDNYQNKWVAWALRNQEDQLAIDEPVNWVTRLGTHNSYNTITDGHGEHQYDPNQFYSMTDQLRVGARSLSVDMHMVEDHARLCHKLEVNVTCKERVLGEGEQELEGGRHILYPAMRYFANGIKEVRNWLDRNPDQIVVVAFENHIGGAVDYVASPLRAYLGDAIYSTIDEGAPGRGGFWPSRRTLLAMPRAGDRLGKQVVLVSNGVVSELEFLQGDYVSGPFDTWFAVRQDYTICRGDNHDDPAPGTDPAVGGPGVAASHEFTVVVENRDTDIFNVGNLNAADIRNAVACNYSIIALDRFAEEPNLGAGDRTNDPDFNRHEAGVWSWKAPEPGYPGEHAGDFGDYAKLEARSGRWVAADPGEVHRFACAPRRSESGTDPSQWLMLEGRWKVTSGSGTWAQGQETCEREFGTIDGVDYVFSVPVNGFQGKRLNKVASEMNAGDVWLNYTDERVEGRWEIPTLFARPVANAGPDQTVACGSTVTLDATGSVADGELTYTWRGPFGTRTGPIITVSLGYGEHGIMLTVADTHGQVATDVVNVYVRDAVPPSMALSLTPTEIWPPNREMVKITANVGAPDDCGDEFVSVVLESIVIREAGAAPRVIGAGSDPQGAEWGSDIQGAEFGTADFEFYVRAERSLGDRPDWSFDPLGRASGPSLPSVAGRVYTVTYEASDPAGNTTAVSADIVVPGIGPGASAFVEDIAAGSGHRPTTSTRFEHIGPNPVVGGPATLEFEVGTDLASAGPVPVSLTVHDVAGRVVSSVHSSDESAGARSLAWNVADEQGVRLKPGFYVLRFRAGSRVETRNLIIIE